MTKGGLLMLLFSALFIFTLTDCLEITKLQDPHWGRNCQNIGNYGFPFFALQRRNIFIKGDDPCVLETLIFIMGQAAAADAPVLNPADL